MPNYNATKSIWRPDAEVNARVHWMFIAQFIFAATFVIIWAKGFAGRGIGAGRADGEMVLQRAGAGRVARHRNGFGLQTGDCACRIIVGSTRSTQGTASL